MYSHQTILNFTKNDNRLSEEAKLFYERAISNHTYLNNPQLYAHTFNISLSDAQNARQELQNTKHLQWHFLQRKIVFDQPYMILKKDYQITEEEQ